MPFISQIYLFPIKSCGGYAVASADLETRGFVGDRRYMLIDERGLFLTQRVHPRMALIRVAPADNGYTVSCAGHPSWNLPVATESGDTRRVTVWRDEVDATAADAGINDWSWDDAVAAIEPLTRRLTVTSHKWMMPVSMLGMTKVAEEQGEWAGKVAMQILDGAAPDSIPVIANRKWDLYLNMSLTKRSPIKLPSHLASKGKVFE